MAKLKRAAFMSYIRFADEHENGRLSEFREQLSGEVRIQTGDDFPIFQDRNDIRWGENWKTRIEESLDSATFLICILTPGFFKSEYCLKEVRRFLEREKKLGREDLVLPVHYVDCPELSSHDLIKRNSLVKLISTRQVVDWRDLRFEPLSSAIGGKALAQIALQIRESMLRGHKTQKSLRQRNAPLKGHGESISEQHVQSLKERETAELVGSRVPKSEVPTRIVDATGKGDYTSVQEAVTKAFPGDKILVRRGVYAERVILDKPLELIGDGLADEIIITAKESVITFQTTFGRIANITMRQDLGEPKAYILNILQGSPVIENCLIVVRGGCAVVSASGSAPRILNCRLLQENAKADVGTVLFGGTDGLIEGSEITGTDNLCVAVLSGAKATIRHNKVTGGLAGLIVWGRAKCIADGNIISGATMGIDISDGGEVVATRNSVQKCIVGIRVYKEGRGTVEDNRIAESSLRGIEVGPNGSATISRNTITQSAEFGIKVSKGGTASLEANIFEKNGGGDISTEDGSSVVQK